MAIQFYGQTSPNTQEQKTIDTKAALIHSNRFKRGEFTRNLILFEKGQLVSAEDKLFFDVSGDQSIIPHRDLQWFLYKESYRRIPLVYNAVNNTVDFAIQSGFELEGSTFAIETIEKWMDKVNFREVILPNILTHMLVYGNAYLDISKTDFPKLLSPETIFVRVTKGGREDGKVIGYVQQINLNSKDNPTFKPQEMIHFKWNSAINPFYGLSEIHPALGAITRYENTMVDLGEILHKLSAPILHYKLGTDEIPATQKQIDEFKGTLEERAVGEDLVTSSAVESTVIGAAQKVMQFDGIIKTMENNIIAALRIPATFARGGESSNKATAQVELESFDRKVKALQKTLAAMIEDFLFSKLTNGKVRMHWNYLSVEGELMRAQQLNSYVLSGIPVEIGLQMVGLGTWVDDVKKAREEQEQKQLELMQAQSQMDAKNSKKSPTGKPIDNNIDDEKKLNK